MSSRKPAAKPAAKKTAPRARATRRATAADQRRYLAMDITAAALMGFREGHATAVAQSMQSMHGVTLEEAVATPLIGSMPVKILGNGTQCAASDPRTDHVAVLLPAAGIMVHPVSLAAPDGSQLENHEACVAACQSLRTLGHDDWELASRGDWNHIIDITRCDPAVDTSLFPGIKPHWHWTSSPVAGRSASAWYVYASSGGVYSYPRDNSGFALAVRRVGQ